MLASKEREQIIWIYGHRKKRILNDPWKHDLIRAYSDTAVYNPFNVPLGYASGATLVQKFHKLVVSRWLPPTDKVYIAGKGYLGKNNPLERETLQTKAANFTAWTSNKITTFTDAGSSDVSKNLKYPLK